MDCTGIELYYTYRLGRHTRYEEVIRRSLPIGSNGIHGAEHLCYHINMKKLLRVSSVLAIVAGIILVVGGIWGICFTYQNVARENITTPDDASIPGVPVRGPLTLKSQADIIRTHVLETTDGKTYSEMPRQIPKLDQNGKPVLDAKNQPVMVANDARTTWVTATTLTTALNLGIVTYVFSVLVLLFGLISIWTGVVFGALSKKY